MQEPITAAEANREFSRVLRSVRDGQSFVVTSHGKPVAKIVPVTEDRHMAIAARANLLARLRSQKPVDIGRWSREELYEEAD
jgi:prevent-host-death family protein